MVALDDTGAGIDVGADAVLHVGVGTSDDSVESHGTASSGVPLQGNPFLCENPPCGDSECKPP